MGHSYEGTTAELLAAAHPTAVKAVICQEIEYDLYSDIVLPGGIFNEWFAKVWDDTNRQLDANQVPKEWGFTARLFVKGVRPVDGDKDHALLQQALAEHQNNTEVYPGTQGITYRDDAFGPYRVTLDDMSRFGYEDEIERSGAAIFGWGSWLDGAFANTVIRRFVNSSNPQRAVIGAWSHDLQTHGSPYGKPKARPIPSPQAQWHESLRFLDHYLMGIRDEALSDKVLFYYTLGEEAWKTTTVWPPEGIATRRWYLAQEGTLSRERPTVELDAESGGDSGRRDARDQCAAQQRVCFMRRFADAGAVGGRWRDREPRTLCAEVIEEYSAASAQSVGGKKARWMVHLWLCRIWANSAASVGPLRERRVMVKVYNNPPLVEALCEFRFDPGSPWDVTVFGHYYDCIHQEFPDKRQTPQVEVSLGKHPGGMVGEVKERGVRMQFSRSDGSAMVQLAPHLLVVNKLPPYESWPVFKTLVLARMADYQEVVGSVPLQQVGLRYINRFDFPAESFSVGTAFESSEFLPRRLMGAPAPFFLRFEMPQGTDGRLVLTVGTIESESPDRVPVLLDLDYQTSITTQVDAAALSSHLDNAHDCIEEAFESCLTDDLRRQLQGEG